MHPVSGNHVTVVGIDEILLDHFDRMDGKRIGVIAIGCGNIRFDCMSESVHTGVSDQFLRHRLCQIRIDDGDIRCDLEVSDRILDALLVIGDDRESGDFGSCT